MKNIILGVTGSIACYKACDIANTLTKEGNSVKVVMTEAGTKFVTPLTFRTLTKNKVYTDMFDDDEPEYVAHIRLAEEADLMVICPASADFIAKAAAGIADDMLTTTYLAYVNKPIIVCPAMNTNMYENPATQRNLEILRERGVNIVEPKVAHLACGTTGKGALADPDVIHEAIAEFI
ncbi:MAG: phosphopantothenoylcysteine decarboxylase [Firmicutes bacterium]|nr:phosphopantothenoylcysteine decarboxylase [Bacillota bacterium]MBR3261050.1 phosphopantothenoylcysteine decarboxylase [Bacillota bacterium]